MEMRGFLFFWSVLTATVAALSLGPSFAHVLESLPRLTRWSPELWRETTVFNAQFQLFLLVGAPLDMAAIACPALLAWMLRDEPRAFWLVIAATLLYALSLALWFMLVKPANDVLATWAPGPIPDNFEAIRLRWETGHMVVTAAKAVGFVSLCLGLLTMRHG
ncbi:MULTISPECIES: DUF1772 domain-containing protein [unclassified Mesorhizobium]|uniref:DUF1772 domain-containing protein n=1 Tax=unclassified Mesorhizobium TaxID=325217 RepID=UPI000BAF0E3F|nr:MULTISPECIES: DUF1772 domain-containing protein [unclassified Mesorhizobium]TGT63981.1 DUF1772 domain-containing protein [Mesorhizobium sp. M00.F.Ca.ET.170.01.1.1]AZO11478.1 DUF1772 domain-containing protein [Mesorhizobium sp. M3A.F.Ca.ET.080.04.2.1]PBB88258.1 hypothetical protein CK216_00460 [Mesorhizobium sp. WSM3876]RWB76802.1 MAG: DUF1772 domain-containing protein [Mesorhizobium sp.]RWB92021.1 MAG: DUF1772 domain-containing protein [Mesorhizobium sp.]